MYVVLGKKEVTDRVQRPTSTGGTCPIARQHHPRSPGDVKDCTKYLPVSD